MADGAPRVRVVPHDEIDLARWDDLVGTSHAATVFHRSDYLSTVAPGWRALVAGDYEHVMPLPVKRIGPHRVVAQPVFTRESGIIGADQPSDEVIGAFASRIVRFPEVSIGVPEVQAAGFGALEASPRTYQLLEIAPDPQAARERYSADTRRLLKKKAGLVEVDVCGHGEVVDLWERTTYRKLDEYHPAHVDTLRALMRLSEVGGWGFGVCARAAGELAAAAWYLRFRDRLVFLMSGVTDEGRSTGAMAFQFDAVITRHRGDARFIDFMGSSIPSIARYFRNFGAEDRGYVLLTSGRSPLWLRAARAIRGRLAG